MATRTAPRWRSMPTPAPIPQGSSWRPCCCTSPALRSAAQSDASPRTAQPTGSAARSSHSQAWRSSRRRFEDQNDRSCHSYPPPLAERDREGAAEEIKRAHAPPPPTLPRKREREQTELGACSPPNCSAPIKSHRQHTRDVERLASAATLDLMAA